jgi:hypothetical protein
MGLLIDVTWTVDVYVELDQSSTPGWRVGEALRIRVTMDQLILLHKLNKKGEE